DIGHRQRDVAGQHDAFVEDAIDKLDQRDVLLNAREPVVHASASTKLYGGHGPVSSYDTPSARCCSSSWARPSRKRRSPADSTRYAAFRNISPACAVTCGAYGASRRASSAAVASSS